MVRKLKYHEKKLLKKVDFIAWDADSNNIQEVKVMRRYQLMKRDDYTAYNKLSREIRELAREIKDIDPKEEFRVTHSALLLEKLYSLGIIANKFDLSICDKVSASSFCKRRLPVLMVKNKMIQSVKMATQLVEQGHVRVGPELVKDPAFLVSKNLEDFITWVDSSKIRRHIMTYNNELDDYEML